MFLKLSYKNKEKEIPIQEDSKNLQVLKEEIEKFTEKKEESLLISFIDVDEEVVHVKDEFDLEYMLEQPETNIVVKIDDKEAEILEQAEELNNELPATVPESSPKSLQNDEPVENQQIPEPNSKAIVSENKEPTIVVGEKVSDDGLKVVTVSVPSDSGFYENHDNECSLDITMINKVFNPKSEHIDNLYDFTKNRETVEDKKYIEENKVPQKKTEVQQPAMDKQAFDELVSSNPTVVDLQKKIDELNKIIEDGFLSIKEEIKERNKTEIQPKTPQRKASVVKTVHKGVTCDNCFKRPIQGKRFKCLECYDFDICEACEAKNVHMHPMMRYNESTDRFQAEQLTQLYVIKNRMTKDSDDDLKIRILKNLAGDKYPQAFYTEFVSKRSTQTFENFIDDVVKIFG